MLILVDAQQHINLGHFIHERLGIALGEASADDEKAAASGMLVSGHFKNGIDGFFLGGSDESAGVDHQDVRFFGPCGDAVSMFFHDAQGKFRVHPVLVAAQGNHADLQMLHIAVSFLAGIHTELYHDRREKNRTRRIPVKACLSRRV